MAIATDWTLPTQGQDVERSVKGRQYKEQTIVAADCIKALQGGGHPQR